MWAYTITRPYTLERQDVPTPSESDLVDGEVLLRLLAAGICGSDLPAFAGSPPLPNSTHGASTVGVPGAPTHEVVGEVVASKDVNTAVGSRVVGWASKANGLTEYVISDGSWLSTYDPALKPENAVMLQPLACVIDAVGRIPTVRGVDAAVIGQGPIGILFSHYLKSAGANRVTGIDRIDRADSAASFNLDSFVHSNSTRWARSLDPADRPNVIVEAVGHQIATIADAVTAVAPQGCIYYFGIPDEEMYPFPLLALLRKNATLIAGTTLDKKRSLKEAGEYLAEYPKLVDSYVSDVFDVRETQAAYLCASRPAPARLKVVLTVGN